MKILTFQNGQILTQAVKFADMPTRSQCETLKYSGLETNILCTCVDND